DVVEPGVAEHVVVDLVGLDVLAVPAHDDPELDAVLRAGLDLGDPDLLAGAADAASWDHREARLLRQWEPALVQPGRVVRAEGPDRLGRARRQELQLAQGPDARASVALPVRIADQLVHDPLPFWQGARVRGRLHDAPVALPLLFVPAELHAVYLAISSALRRRQCA